MEDSRKIIFHLQGDEAGIVWINRRPSTKPKTTKQTNVRVENDWVVRGKGFYQGLCLMMMGMDNP